jgi:hypothetical protein
MNVRPHFNPELNWGHILSAGTFAIFGLVAFFALQRDLSELRVETKVRLTALEKTMSLLAENLVKVGEQIYVDIKQTEKIDGHDRRLDIQARRLDRLEAAVFRVPSVVPQENNR